LAVGFGLFAFGIIGGGDAKLFAAVALMFGYDDLLGYTVFALLLGGALTLVILVLRQVPLPEVLARESWIARLHAPDSGVPYGVALAAGAYLLLPYSVIFHAVAAG
jgi:prepilin peptidase CpaA